MKNPKSCRAKTRMRGDRPRIIVREQCDHDDPSSRHAPGHMGGDFSEAGYNAGKGQFGFQQTDLTGG